MQRFNMNDEKVFAIETNTTDSHFSRRYDPAKYLKYFDKLSEAIMEIIPDAVMMKNQIPKSWQHHDMYSNLVPNDDPTQTYFEQVPRPGALELSYQGHLISSKLQSNKWPNCQFVAEKCQGILNAIRNGEDIEPFLAGYKPPEEDAPKKKSLKRGGGSGSLPRLDQGTGMYGTERQARRQGEYLGRPKVFDFVSENFKDQRSTSQTNLKPKTFFDKEDKNGTQPWSFAPSQSKKTVLAGSHLQSANDLTSKPRFKLQRHENGSLLAKHLTDKVWDQLHDAKDPHGFSFKEAIFSGCKNTDSAIGVYAGSAESYDAFAALFRPIVQDYHNYNVSRGHRSDMDFSKLKCPPISAEDAAMIKSTRIRVARNLAEFPLGPAVTREQRNQIEQKVVQACNTFTGELAGTYYSLSSMTAAQQQQLINDHFLFKEGDRFLDAAGLNRNWPEGRGIFHNNVKTFLVWVNEEDQLRIISMQPGFDIVAVFTRLSKGCQHIESVASFSHNDKLGYITSCPSNLGTALRASVHIHLPQLGANKKEYNAIADRFKLQIRGIHGEHSESADHIYDVSNKRRLGLSEVELVQDFYNGVKALIAREKELVAASQRRGAAPQRAGASQNRGAPQRRGAQEETKTGPHLKKPEDIKGFPIFPPGTKSLLSKCLTRDVWDQLQDKRDKSGVSLRDVIFSGCKNLDSGIGVYAGSHDSYATFGPLMDKIIQQYHGHAKGDRHKSNMDHTKLRCPPFSALDAAMIKSTRIRVGRNLVGYPLGPAVTREQRNEIKQKVVQACSQFQGELAGTFYSLGSMTQAQQNQLIADHFLFKEGDRFLDAAGLNRDWPEGRGIYHNNEKTFLVWVNEEDQLRLISMQAGADIGAVFRRLCIAASNIEMVARFAHDQSLGYITSCPSNLGTALRASVHIQLPKLGERMDLFQAIANQYYVQIRGIHGEHSETADHVYDISNKRRLGRSEVDLVQDMYNGVKAMIEKEKELGGGAQPAAEAFTPDADEEEVKCGPHLTNPEMLTGFPNFPGGTKSLLSKWLTRQIWYQLKNTQDSAGLTFKAAILSGCQNLDSEIGVYAGSEDSYTTFAPLMDRIIEGYHGHAKGVLLAERPFLEHWDLMAELEARRKEGDFQKSNMDTMEHFMDEIGYEEFLKHARRTVACTEIAKFYDNSLQTPDDLTDLVAKIQDNKNHSDPFYYGVYFAAWIKKELIVKKRAFKDFDRQIEGQIKQGGSIQFMLREIVKNYLTFNRFVDTFNENNMNGITEYLNHKDIYSEEDFSELDEIEARHLMDQIVLYSSLRETRLHQVQARLGIFQANLYYLPFAAADAAMIKSTRIRVARNLAGYPLGPAVTLQQRKEIEQKVVQACNTFQGELSGNYYSLGTMTAQQKNQLIADHILFKEDDKFQNAIGLNRDWPEGRGIFHNSDKTFLVWVNEEDQLRIISRQPGADIGAVFTRLATAVAQIEKVATFAHDDDNLGYITSCPTNLGTALRASVHIKLPKLGTRMDEFQALADQHHVQIRGTHGQHSQSSDHVYDISNKRRLGRSEVELVQDMYNGVQALIAREKTL